MTFKLEDYMMKCCGIVGASGIAIGQHEGYDEANKRYYTIQPSQADWDRLFDRIEKHQYDYRRNCAMMVLASYQHDARREAERRGYKEVFSFLNPNSGFPNGIFVKALWKERSEFFHDQRMTALRESREHERQWTQQHSVEEPFFRVEVPVKEETSS